MLINGYAAGRGQGSLAGTVQAFHLSGVGCLTPLVSANYVVLQQGHRMGRGSV